MTLTLDDVRRIRFPMARRPGDGYRAAEVDDFVDKVDATFAAMTDETERLKAQLEALKSGDAAAQPADSGLADENKELKAQLEQLRKEQSEGVSPAAELESARQARKAAEDENASLKEQVEKLRAAQSATDAKTQDAARAQADAAELARLRGENEKLTAQLADARRSAEAAKPAALADGAKADAGKVEKIEVTTAAEASPAVVRMVELAIADAERVVKEAEVEAGRKVAAAEQKAHELTVDAQTRAERIESVARVNAEKVTSDAKANADQVNVDAQNRRNDLFSQLETERDTLAGKVDHLRSFESTYRESLVNHLRSQADNLDKGVFEPQDLPDLLKPEQRAEKGASATPRLDALIGRGQQAHGDAKN